MSLVKLTLLNNQAVYVNPLSIAHATQSGPGVIIRFTDGTAIEVEGTLDEVAEKLNRFGG